MHFRTVTVTIDRQHPLPRKRSVIGEKQGNRLPLLTEQARLRA